MKLTLLGTGTPTPSLKRQSSGYLVEIGTDKIVMDHGPGAHHRLIESGHRAVDVTHVLLSHLHYDHCMDYPRLVLQRWDMAASKAPELKVFGPPPLKRMTEQLFGRDGVFWPDIHARTENQISLDIYVARGGVLPRRPPYPEVREILPGDVIEEKGWRATVARASHVQPQLECCAFRIDAAEGSLCYSGDSGGVCEDVIGLARGADVLVHMLHFMTGTEPSAAYRQGCGSHIDTAHVAQAAGVKTLVLSHMLEHIDRPGRRERILYEMSMIYDGTIIWGEDLMEIDVSAKPASQVRID